MIHETIQNAAKVLKSANTIQNDLDEGLRGMWSPVNLP